MTTQFMEDAFELGRIIAPDQWTALVAQFPEFLQLGGAVRRTDAKTLTLALEKKINSMTRSINHYEYQRDIDRTGLADVWYPDRGGDCEDKALYLIQRLIEMQPEIAGSLRLAICELKNGPIHAVAVLETKDRDYVIDPTLATYMVDWRVYPVKNWVMRLGFKHLWQNFKPKKNGETT